MNWKSGVVIATLLGAIASLMLAWGCVLWSPQRAQQMQSLVTDDPLVRPHAAYGQFDRAMTNARMGFGWRIDRVMSFRGGYAGGPYNASRTLHRAGWPWYCLQGEDWRVHGEPGPVIALMDSPAVLRPNPRPMNRLPLRPIWAGLLANAAVFAVGPVLFLLSFPLRRSVRRRRNQCPACAYSLEGLKSREEDSTVKCPECGELNRRRPSSAQ